MVLKRYVHDKVSADSSVAALKKALVEQTTENNAALANLPTIDDDPIGTVHETVFQIWESLSLAIQHQHAFTDKLHFAQVKLNTDLSEGLPMFLPFFESHDDKAETYEAPIVQGWDGMTSKEYIYLDEVQRIVHEWVLNA